MERDSKVGESEMLQEFLESHMENDLMGFEDIRSVAVSDTIDIMFTDEGSLTNYCGW
ncbi:hypothetical protein D3C71_1675770 [compost metagenome]